MYSVNYSLRSQSGITLIISLILLLLLTLIAVSGMKITNLQEKMAGNDRDRSLAFQAAEAALRAGERKLEELRLGNYSIRIFCNGSPNQVTAPIGGLFHQVQADNKTSADTDIDRYCEPCTTACPLPDIYTPSTWTDASKSIVFDTGNTALASQPRYFITYVETHLKPDPTASGNTYSPIYTFVIVARGVGMQAGSEVILRSYAGGSTDFIY